MENLAQRRLQSIARHFISQELVIHDLSPNPASAAVSPSPVIIGGMVLDVHAKPHKGKDAIPGTTAPGMVKLIHGGVARNVAECMSKLETKPFIVSVVGMDPAGEILSKHWESAGLSTEGILKTRSAATPAVSNTFDYRGELAVGVASVAAVERFVTPEIIQQFRHTICSAPVLMVDANLHPRSLEAASKVAAEADIPVWFEPVSVAKATRIASVAKYITIASPNEDELIAMANALSSEEEFRAMKQKLTRMKEESIDSSFHILKPAISLLLEKGIKVLVVTLGANGIFVCFRGGATFVKHPLKNCRTPDSKMHLYNLMHKSLPPKWYTSFLNSGSSGSRSYAFHLPAFPATVVSLTGAGDCLVGGILASICNGLDMMKSVAIGIAVAKATVQ
ncbi:uncharacterized protein A4U43_C08F11490 [Asparagus officinalis]|uniref:uncharacterized protein LOC109821008 n=1 Tax=Asparagus officinalis TaxID=4686 RepID=UPI00098E4D49|nr:uncharacterized protein LOC109821008 [Asparagus officinalis]ONK59839.1 uncharacterized protein A4U43_C08F11490 [Asparagus officinalis]